MKRKILIPSLIILSIIIGYLTFQHFNSPSYSLKKIGKTIENHNYNEFQKLVDVKDLSNNLIDSYLEGEGKDSKGIVELMRNKMNEKLSTEIKELVESTERVNKKGRVSSILRNKLNLENIKNTEISGNIAKLDLEINLTKLDTTLILTAKMRKLDDNWQLFGFEKLAEFLNNVEVRKKEVLKKENKSVKDKIKNSLGYEGFKLRLIKKNFTDYIISTDVSYKNTSEKEITEYYMEMKILDKNLKKLISLNFNHNWNSKPIKPNETITETLEFSINRFDNSELIKAIENKKWTQKFIDKKLVLGKDEILIVKTKL